MTSRGVSLGPPTPTKGTAQRPFVIGTEENVSVSRSSHFINPKILILTALGAVFFLFSLVYDPSSQQLTPLQKQIRDSKVMERQLNYLREVEKIDGSGLQRTMSAIERQILIVSRAEAKGDTLRAQQELLKLMVIDGGHANSPLYKFCVSKVKEYQ